MVKLMLSALQQGSLVHIIDKTKGIKYLVGEVINRTEPNPDYTNPNISMPPQSFFDLSVKVGDEKYEFKHLNSTLTTANNGSIIISENKEGLLPIVESILYNSKKIIEPENIEYHTKAVADCETIMKKLNPTFAKEKERDARIENLESKVNGMDDKLDKIFNLINKQ